MSAQCLRHGDGQPPPVESLLWNDPELGLVYADMAVWMEAHPCKCEALCECAAADEPEGDAGMSAASFPRWRSSALTGTAHLVRRGGYLVCGTANVVLAADDEGGIACGHCVRLTGERWLPPRGGVSPSGKERP